MKGQKTGGRQAGTPNKVTARIREQVERILERLGESIESDFDDMPLTEKMNLYAKLVEFAIPKLARTTVQDENQSSNRFQIIINSKPLRDGD